MSLDTFHPFSRLPKEIRLSIWILSFPGPRILCPDHFATVENRDPIALQVNYESRTLAQQYYSILSTGRHSHLLYINYEIDTFLFEIGQYCHLKSGVINVDSTTAHYGSMQNYHEIFSGEDFKKVKFIELVLDDWGIEDALMNFLEGEDLIYFPALQTLKIRTFEKCYHDQPWRASWNWNNEENGYMTDEELRGSILDDAKKCVEREGDGAPKISILRKRWVETESAYGVGSCSTDRESIENLPYELLVTSKFPYETYELF